MNDEQRSRILQEARDNVDRLASVRPRERIITNVINEDKLAAWKRTMPKPEPKPRQRGLDTAPVDWSSIIDERIGNMKEFVMDVLGQALCESFNIERGAYADALKERDRKIGQLELDLLRAQAELARLNTRVIQGEVDRDRESKVIDVPLVTKQRDSIN
jgi:hypothetical protein